VEYSELTKRVLKLSREDQTEFMKALLAEREVEQDPWDQWGGLVETWAEAGKVWYRQHGLTEEAQRFQTRWSWGGKKPTVVEETVRQLTNEGAVLTETDVKARLDEWFRDTPFLVRASFKDTEAGYVADPMGGILMSVVDAMMHDVIELPQAISQCVWRDEADYLVSLAWWRSSR
jgi:hypothetical protein